MDLLLTHGYFLYEDPKELQVMKPYVPLGILYIASYLRAKGVAVEVFDTTFSRREELFALLRSTPPAVLGVYGNLMTRPNVVEILRAAKDAGWKTVAGGPEPGAYIEEYLAAGADVVVIGEGEVTVEELLPALDAGRIGSVESKQALARVNGIAFLGEDGSIHQTPARTQIPDLDRQAWPLRAAAPTIAAGAATRSSARRTAAGSRAPSWMSSSGSSIAISPTWPGWPTTSSPSIMAGYPNTPPR